MPPAQKGIFVGGRRRCGTLADLQFSAPFVFQNYGMVLGVLYPSPPPPLRHLFANKQALISNETRLESREGKGKCFSLVLSSRVGKIKKRGKGGIKQGSAIIGGKKLVSCLTQYTHTHMGFSFPFLARFVKEVSVHG